MAVRIKIGSDDCTQMLKSTGLSERPDQLRKRGIDVPPLHELTTAADPNRAPTRTVQPHRRAGSRRNNVPAAHTRGIFNQGTINRNLKHTPGYRREEKQIGRAHV